MTTKNTPVIAWTAPPEPRVANRQVSRHQPVLDALKGRPGEWALVYEDVSRNVSSWFKAQGCEVKTRRVSDSYDTANADIYARWPEAVPA